MSLKNIHSEQQHESQNPQKFKATLNHSKSFEKKPNGVRNMQGNEPRSIAVIQKESQNRLIKLANKETNPAYSQNKDHNNSRHRKIIQVMIDERNKDFLNKNEHDRIKFNEEGTQIKQPLRRRRSMAEMHIINQEKLRDLKEGIQNNSQSNIRTKRKISNITRTHVLSSYKSMPRNSGMSSITVKNFPKTFQKIPSKASQPSGKEYMLKIIRTEPSQAVPNLNNKTANYLNCTPTLSLKSKSSKTGMNTLMNIYKNMSQVTLTGSTNSVDDKKPFTDEKLDNKALTQYNLSGSNTNTDNNTQNFRILSNTKLTPNYNQGSQVISKSIAISSRQSLCSINQIDNNEDLPVIQQIKTGLQKIKSEGDEINDKENGKLLIIEDLYIDEVEEPSDYKICIQKTEESDQKNNEIISIVSKDPPTPGIFTDCKTNLTNIPSTEEKTGRTTKNTSIRCKKNYKRRSTINVNDENNRIKIQEINDNYENMNSNCIQIKHFDQENFSLLNDLAKTNKFSSTCPAFNTKVKSDTKFPDLNKGIMTLISNTAPKKELRRKGAPLIRNNVSFFFLKI